jgi:hypothetical protein
LRRKSQRAARNGEQWWISHSRTKHVRPNRAKLVTHPRHDGRLGTTLVDEKLENRTVHQDIADALARIERANAKLRPEELCGSEARSLIDACGRIV